MVLLIVERNSRITLGSELTKPCDAAGFIVLRFTAASKALSISISFIKNASYLFLANYNAITDGSINLEVTLMSREKITGCKKKALYDVANSVDTPPEVLSQLSKESESGHNSHFKNTMI